MTQQEIVARLRDILLGEQYWSNRDLASGRSPEYIAGAALSYLREGITMLADELQAGR